MEFRLEEEEDEEEVVEVEGDMLNREGCL